MMNRVIAGLAFLTSVVAYAEGVPTFLAKGLPDEAVPSAAALMGGIEKGVLPTKVKHLLALAVASQIPCRYCVIAHKTFLEAGGASDVEVREAIGLAAGTRFFSTWLNGTAPDEAAFRRETDQILAYAKKMGASGKMPAPIVVTDAASAQKDMEQLLGRVPSFFKGFPEAAAVPAWQQMKAIQLNPKSAIAGKYKELIGLGVASQIPCRYCVYFHTEAAKLYGATDAEIKEAVATAALTRFLSTVANGVQQDEMAFRKEVQAMADEMRKQMTRK